MPKGPYKNPAFLRKKTNLTLTPKSIRDGRAVAFHEGKTLSQLVSELLEREGQRYEEEQKAALARGGDKGGDGVSGGAGD